MKRNNVITKWLDENQDPEIAAKVKAEAEQKYKAMKTPKEKAEELQTKVTCVESDPFFVTMDGGGPVLEDTDIVDGGQVDA